jgi:aminopeptidase N
MTRRLPHPRARLIGHAVAGLALAMAGCRSAAPPALYGRTAAAQVAPRPDDGLDIRRYDTRLALDIANKSVVGETRITFAYSGPGPRELRFPRNALAVERVTYEDQSIAFVTEGTTIAIPLPELPRRTEEHVSIAYHATPERGLVFRDGLVYTDFFTCHWMPCSEEPGDKASFGLELIVPASYKVVASGALAEERVDEVGRRHARWEQARPYSPYLFGFAAGEFVEAGIRAGHARLRFLGLRSSETADSLHRKFRDTPRMLAFLSGRAGLALPEASYTQILVPGAEAQEKSTFSLIGAEFLDPILEDPTEDWVIAHELAHQWWGNLVTCRGWSHFWLNEGTATFLVAAYKEKRWGRAAYERELGLWRERVQVARGAGFDVPLAYAGSYPSLRVRRAIQYSKAALFLHVLRGRLGERAFWKGVAAFIRGHAGGTVVSADFQRAMEAASGQDLAPLFGEWVYPTAAATPTPSS